MLLSSNCASKTIKSPSQLLVNGVITYVRHCIIKAIIEANYSHCVRSNYWNGIIESIIETTSFGASDAIIGTNNA